MRTRTHQFDIEIIILSLAHAREDRVFKMLFAILYI